MKAKIALFITALLIWGATASRPKNRPIPRPASRSSRLSPDLDAMREAMDKRNADIAALSIPEQKKQFETMKNDRLGVRKSGADW